MVKRLGAIRAVSISHTCPDIDTPEHVVTNLTAPHRAAPDLTTTHQTEP